MNQLSVQDLAAWLADSARAQPLLLDVREPWEVRTAAIPGALNIPMQEIPARFVELEPGRDIVSICHHGGRSMQVALFLEHQGRTMHNLAGGIDAWSREIDPAVPRY
jgi:rhodanese-related sulfurtransferase